MTLTDHALLLAVIEVGERCTLEVGLPWYRSMPFSAIVSAELDLDGGAVHGLEIDPGDGLRPIAELVDCSASWFLQDRHRVSWTAPAPSRPQAEVRLRFRLHLPNVTRPDSASVQVLQQIDAVVGVLRA